MNTASLDLVGFKWQVPRKLRTKISRVRREREREGQVPETWGEWLSRTRILEKVSEWLWQNQGSSHTQPASQSCDQNINAHTVSFDVLVNRILVETRNELTYYRWEDGPFPVFASCVTISNPNSLSSSETGVNAWMKSFVRKWLVVSISQRSEGLRLSKVAWIWQYQTPV